MQVAIVSAVLAAVLGVVLGWIGAYLKARGESAGQAADFRAALHRLEQNTAAVERIKLDVARQGSVDAELRQAVKQTTTAISALIHSICWLTWDCTARQRLDAEMVRKYDDEAHRLMPDIIGQLAGVAMFQSALHSKLSPLADDIIDLDADVGEAVVLAEKDLAAGLRQLEKCHSRGMALERQVRTTVTDVFAAQMAVADSMSSSA